MSDSLSVLGFERRWYHPGGHEAPFEYLEILVDGQPLRDRSDWASHLPDLHVNRPELVAERLDVLAGRAPDPQVRRGRVVLLTCPACADLGCGVVSAGLSFPEGQVRWSGFAYETDWWIDDPGERYVPQEPGLTLAFARAQYLAALDAARRLGGGAQNRS